MREKFEIVNGIKKDWLIRRIGLHYITFALHDTNGYVGDFGSAHGIKQLYEALSTYPLIHSFLGTGFSEQLDDLEAELELAIQNTTDPEIKAGAEHVLGLIRECEDAAFITDEWHQE